MLYTENNKNTAEDYDYYDYYDFLAGSQINSLNY